MIVNLGSGCVSGTGSDAGGDTLTQIENVTGSALNGGLTGDDNANWLVGLFRLDSLEGGFGNDDLEGGSGADRLVGGPGIALLIGGTGEDVFLFVAVTETANTTADRINDFTPGDDVVSFAGLGLTLGVGNVTGANQIRWDVLGSRLLIDVDGNGNVDRQIGVRLSGQTFDATADLIP